MSFLFLTLGELYFLNCLRGSERAEGQFDYQIKFLSCLYGSELQPENLALRYEFLSCLYGSELLVPEG